MWIVKGKFSSEEVFDSLSLAEQFVGGLLDAGLRDLVVNVKAGNGGVLAILADSGEGEHEASGDTVELAIGLEGNRLPVIGALNPVAHVVDGSVTSGSSGGELSELDNLSTSLLHTRSELISSPCSINELGGSLAFDGGVADIRVHGGGVVAPDGHLLNVSDLGTSLEGELGEGSVVVKTGHGSEVLSGDTGCVVLADHSVGVSGVTDDDGLAGALGMVVDSFSGVNEDLAVVLEEVSTFHPGSTGLGTNKEVVVNILEGNVEVGSDDDVVKERESAIVELSHDTLENLLLEGEVEQVKDHSLVLAEELATKAKKGE